LTVNPATKVKDLSVGKQQLIEIAKALSRDVKLLILDEPTAALNEVESDNLLALLRGLRTQGVTCILISHKLREVFAIADSVTVLRDGQTIITLDAKKGEVSEAAMIKYMVGREIENIYPRRETIPPGEIVLEVKGWTAFDTLLGRDVLKDIRFNVRKGEIVGFAGLMGSGGPSWPTASLATRMAIISRASFRSRARRRPLRFPKTPSTQASRMSRRIARATV
jgi:putative multiple sugar transport system ATP-binding protein